MASTSSESTTISREGLRLLLLHEHRLGSSARKAADRINQSMGPGTVSHMTATRWFDRFKHGDYDLEDKQHPGRPPVFDLTSWKLPLKRIPVSRAGAWQSGSDTLKPRCFATSTTSGMSGKCPFGSHTNFRLRSSKCGPTSRSLFSRSNARRHGSATWSLATRSGLSTSTTTMVGNGWNRAILEIRRRKAICTRRRSFCASGGAQRALFTGSCCHPTRQSLPISTAGNWTP